MSEVINPIFDVMWLFQYQKKPTHADVNCFVCLGRIRDLDQIVIQVVRMFDVATIAHMECFRRYSQETFTAQITACPNEYRRHYLN